ncbi:MAG: PorV/PorQ family protein [Bacteroidota bacterium]|nr:PorV/PorQ family protein [Bacteroidota bacterium]MDP4193049.1 PorV/PorQ family protein [Bacteroidota bacterium]MDP4194205.1 PorV/PorQ family protein [Bacteroidota bacterium]
MLKNLIFIISAIILFQTTNAKAQSNSSSKTGVAKYAGEFLAIGVGGRANGMGGAYAAVANDVTAGYWNPAALSRLDYPQIALMYSQNFGNLVNYNYAAVGIPYGSDMSFGLSVIRLSVDGIPDTREALVDIQGNVIYDITNPSARQIDPSKVKEFSNTDWAFYFTFAKRHSEKLSYGANVKIIRRDIAEYGATGIGFDVGAMYNPTERLFLGANIQDITTTLVAWNTGQNELISPTAKLGAAYALDLLAGKLMPAADIDIRFENRRYASEFHVGPVSFDAHLGMEYSYKDLFAVRMGYNDVKNFTIGAGVKLPKLNIDYSYARYAVKENSLGDSHKISLSLTLEEAKYKRKSE